jgi:hypothetical protein
LIAAFKVGEKSSLFNFEAVHSKYKNYMKSHLSQLSSLQCLSKQAFIKIFLDLTDKGFLRSESDTDILSVNNKIALGFRAKDLEEVL